MPSIRPQLKAQNKPLTEKEQIFVERYLTHWNGARAAREAGYSFDNASNASRAAMELRNKPYIKNAIDERIRNICMDANEALGRLAAMARGDIMDFLSKDDRGNWHVDLDKAKRSGKSFLIKSYRQPRLGPAEIELYSASDALDKICRHLNLFKDEKTDVSLSLSAWAVFVKEAERTATTPDTAPINPNYQANSRQHTFVDVEFTELPTSEDSSTIDDSLDVNDDSLNVDDDTLLEE